MPRVGIKSNGIRVLSNCVMQYDYAMLYMLSVDVNQICRYTYI